MGLLKNTFIAFSSLLFLNCVPHEENELKWEVGVKSVSIVNFESANKLGWRE